MSALSGADFSQPGDLCRRFGHYLQVWEQRVNIKRDMVLDRETNVCVSENRKQEKHSFTT